MEMSCSRRTKGTCLTAPNCAEKLLNHVFDDVMNSHGQFHLTLPIKNNIHIYRMQIYNFEQEAIMPSPDEMYMKEALKLAQKAFEEDEVPIGAVIVCKGKIIGKGYNLTERLHDVTAHAEMQAFTAAANFMGGKYL